MRPLRVLLVEDSAEDAELMLRALKAGGFDPVHERVETPAALRSALEGSTWDVVLSDYYLPELEAPAALALVRERAPDTPFLVVSGSMGEDTAVAAMKSGAVDYIMKDRLQRLAPAVERAIEDAAVRRERRRLEQQLLASQRLEAVGRLAGGVAHDFNNVLTAVLGSTELLILDTPPGVANREELEIIREAATRAQDLIRQLLAFSSRQALKPVVLDLNHLVKSVGKMLRRLIGENIQLVTEPAAELDSLCADPGQLEQVLVNLAVNARDAMPQGGRLTIATSNLQVAEGAVVAVPPGHYVVLRVTDTGTGMDAATMERAFEPFFTTKPKGKGTGLGLATVYGIVRQSGGTWRWRARRGRARRSASTSPASWRPRISGSRGRSPRPRAERRRCWWWRTTRTSASWPARCWSKRDIGCSSPPAAKKPSRPRRRTRARSICS